MKKTLLHILMHNGRLPATVTNMLKPLEEKKLIQRKIDPKTNRAILVSLRTEGEQACIKIQAAWDLIEARMVKNLPKTGMADLFRSLETIRYALGGKEPTDRSES